jgi:lipopolysaccharide export system protein LptC
MNAARERFWLSRGEGLSTTSTLDGMDDRGFAGSGRGDTERMFRRAMRHSRRVRLLRAIIPAAIVLTLLAVWFVTWLDPLRLLVRLPADSGKLVISGTKLTMQAPRLSGFTRDGRAYELTARAAAQDITKPDVVELYDVRARIEAEDRSVMSMRAADGLFNRKSGMLTLGNDIVLESTGGLEVRLSEAVIDTGSGQIVSNRPVEVRMLQGTVNAQRLEVVNAGEVIHFEGGVVMDLAAGALESGKAEGAKP